MSLLLVRRREQRTLDGEPPLKKKKKKTKNNSSNLGTTVEAHVCAHVFVRSFEKIKSPRRISVYVDVEESAKLEVVRYSTGSIRLRISSIPVDYDIYEQILALKLFSVVTPSPFRMEIVLRVREEIFAIMLTDVDSSRKLNEFAAALKYYMNTKNTSEITTYPQCHRFSNPTSTTTKNDNNFDCFTSIYAVFSKQRDAFTFLDNMKSEKQLRVFSLETNRSSRKFIVTTESTCFQRILSLPANQRHYYEIIRENVPCRLYFDLEFEINENPDLDGDEMTRDLVKILIKHLKLRYELVIDETNVLELGSSSSKKFSRHLVIHLPSNAIFRNTSHVGSFVSDMLQSHDKLFWVKSSRDEKVRFVDESVYSRNRAFRMFLCSKRGKDALLLTSERNQFIPTDNTTWRGERELFRNALVVPSKMWKHNNKDEDHVETTMWCTKKKQDMTILYAPCNNSKKIKATKNDDENKMSLRNNSRKELAPREIEISIIPEAVEFVINSVLKSWGTADKKTQHLSYIRIVTAQQVRDPLYPVTMSGVPTVLVFEVVGNRFCARIGRHHRSNNISFVLCVHRGVWYQRCHDYDCRHFRSRESKIPFDVVESTLVRLLSLL